MNSFFYSASQTEQFPVSKCKMQDQSITCDLVPLPPLLLLGQQLADTASSDIEETEWKYSSQTDCASFTSDISPVKK